VHGVCNGRRKFFGSVRVIAARTRDRALVDNYIQLGPVFQTEPKRVVSI